MSARAAPHADVAVIREVLERVFGYDSRAIRLGVPDATSPETDSNLKRLFGRLAPPARVLFLDADKALFTGLLPPTPIVFVNSTDLAYLRATYGVHYPVAFPSLWFNAAHTKAVVKWSAGWVGGTLEFKRAGSGWRCRVVSQWIT